MSALTGWRDWAEQVYDYDHEQQALAQLREREKHNAVLDLLAYHAGLERNLNHFETNQRRANLNHFRGRGTGLYSPFGWFQ